MRLPLRLALLAGVCALLAGLPVAPTRTQELPPEAMPLQPLQNIAGIVAPAADVSPELPRDLSGIIDKMVAVTVAQFPDQASADTYCAALVANDNLVLAGDPLQTYRNRLVGCPRYVYTAVNANDDLVWIASGAGHAQADADRTRFGADVVQFVTASSDACGIGYQNAVAYGRNFGYSMLSKGCMGGTQYSNIHEQGHNWGAAHDLPNQTPSYPYGSGYCQPGGFTIRRDVMTYPSPCGGTRGPYFSNPNILINGLPFGDAALADNARVLREKAAVLAGFTPCAVNCTPASPPAAPTNVAATDGTSTTTVTVTWTASTGASSYSVYRSTSNGVQGSLLGTTTATTLVDSTPTPGTTYWYGVTATNANGTSALSTQNSGFAAIAVPSIPTGVSASDGTSQNVTISWSASSGATSYTIYRSTTQGVQGSSIGTDTASPFTDSTVTPTTVYWYSLTATGPGGTSAVSAQDSGFGAAPTLAAPTNVAASDGTSTTSVSITWTASVNATGYTIFRSTTQGVQGSQLGTAGTTAFVDGTPVPGTTYWYGVVATGAGGIVSSLSVQNSGFAAVPATTGLLSGTALAVVTPVNLTTTGTADWAHWPDNATFIHKATGGTQIANRVVVGTGTLTSYTGDARTLTWSDGTATVSGSSTSGIYVTGANTGFRLTAPASTAQRTLIVYIGGWHSTGILSATLSDSSAAAFNSGSTGSNKSAYDRAYSLVYKAATASQTLTVQWLRAGGKGNVRLQGATLTSP